MSYLDMLTRLGVGSAHPGGFSATLQQLRQFPLPAGSRVLEVGCGTGRTACHLAKLGFDITGLDIRSEMLAKAKLRAETEGLSVSFVHGSIDALPFADQTFDVILGESVTNFSCIPAAIKEYYRVLRQGGVLYDREVMQVKEMPEPAFREVVRFFGFGGLLSEEAWLRTLAAAGFSYPQAWNRSMFQEHLTAEYEKTPDMLQMVDGGTFLDPAVWKTSIEHDELLRSNREYMGYALFVAVKE